MIVSLFQKSGYSCVTADKIIDTTYNKKQAENVNQTKKQYNTIWQKQMRPIK